MAVLTRVLIGVIPVLLGLSLRPGVADARQASESDIKAAFLYNFTKYIEWPTTAFASASDPFRVCLLADEALTHSVSNFIAGERVHGRQLQLIAPRAPDLPRCHILFVGRESAGRASAVLAATAGRPILTVGETPDFLEKGGVVLFHVEDQRVRFDLHLQAATRAGLTVSSKLVRVARYVRDGLPR